MNVRRLMPFLEWGPSALRDREGLKQDFFAGLTCSVWVGLVLPAVLCLRRLARPVLRIEDGGAQTHAHLDGSLFFGSAPAVARRLRECGERCGFRGTLHLHLENAAYIDADGQRMLREERQRWMNAGGEMLVTGNEREA